MECFITKHLANKKLKMYPGLSVYLSNGMSSFDPHMMIALCSLISVMSGKSSTVLSTLLQPELKLKQTFVTFTKG